ncbi:hypothetical protein HDU79_004256 [Rhizoclosmatium sp. JEL0117]|nr:hypothetical protein HDU79_004256 [Rhizoclosmatium sp. JEL0117]
MDLVVKRLAQAATLRSSILSTAVNASASSLAAVPVRKSVGSKMLNYHNPDVSLLGLSSQDKSLDVLGLKDVWVESWLSREEDFKKRGKAVRVGVLSGRLPKAVDDGKGGKKKKRK